MTKTYNGSVAVSGGTGLNNGSAGTTNESQLPYLTTPVSYTSAVLDTGQASAFTTMTFNKTTPANTTLTVDIRAGNTATPDETWTGWTTNVSSGGSISALSGNRYIQYRANLQTSDSDVTPSLDDVTINYQSYPASATLTSSVYDSGSAFNVMSNIHWTESLLAGTTDVQFQIQTSADGNTWTGWEGPSGNSSSYFTAPDGTGESMPANFVDGVNDRYFQYKVFLSTTNAAYTPTLSDVSVTYAVNAPPEFNPAFGTNGVTISQISSSSDLAKWGKVQIDYAIKDIDTDTIGNVTRNYITPTFEYSLNGGGAWSDVNLANVTFGSAPSGGDITDLNSDGKQDNKVLQGSYLTYTAYWDAKTQINGTYSNNNFQIRVKIDDNEAANRYAIAIGNTISLDTTNPSVGAHPILIDASAIPANLTLSASDNSTLKMKVSLTNSFPSVLTDAYSASPTISLETDPDTVYVEYQDIYGNTTNVSSATTPETPIDLMIQDTSNLLLSSPEYRLFTAWKTATVASPNVTQYNVLRSTNGTSYSSFDTVVGRTTNYYGDNSVNYNTDYYYKITAQDSDGNISYRSAAIYGKANGTQDAGEGGGGGDATAPAISNVQIGNITSSGATVTWTTDELSNSTVGYSTSAATFTAEIGVSTYVTGASHSVVLTGLTSGTPYYLQAKSMDASNNVGTANDGGNGYTFQTLSADTTPPIISNISSGTPSFNHATITWDTNEDSNSFVEYSTSNGFSHGTLFGNYTAVSSPHSVTLNNLSVSTTYYFKVHSSDASGNERISPQSSFATIADPADVTDPEISEISSGTPSYDTATIAWTTDENSNSYVEYGTTTSYGSIFGKDDSVESHSVVLPSVLLASTTYHFKVHSTDASGNEGISGDTTFATIADPADVTDPVISEVEVASTSRTGAIITWTTNEDSTSYVGYSTDESYSKEQGQPELTQSHSVTLVGLTAGTLYNFQIKSEDASHNLATGTNVLYFFTTDAGASAPAISAVTSESLSYNSATITWTTNPAANSFVEYGLTTSYGKAAGKYDSVTSHSIQLTSLSAGTTYHFRVRSTVEAEGVSGDYTFMTSAAPDSTGPIISSVSSGTPSYNTATITWTTNENSDSHVEYGATAAYGKTYGDENLTTTHSVTFPTDLSASTTYHFRVKSRDASNNLTNSDDGIFVTIADPADVTGPTISNVSSGTPSWNTATITWNTNEDATSYVEYGTTTSYGRIYGSNALDTLHSVSIPADLSGSTLYNFRVRSVDASNNITVSSNVTFTTSAAPDSTGPGISSVSSGSITVSSATISWITNEAANSLIEYGTTTSYTLRAGNESESVTNHSVSLSGLNYATTYHYRIKSKDSSNNETVSDDQTFTTAADTAAPEISAVVIQVISDSQAIITWTTDENATSQVTYGIAEDDLSSSSSEISPVRKYHYIILTGLEANTTYYFKAKSKDSSGNEAESGGDSFTTSKDPEYQHGALSEITDISDPPTVLTDKKAVISFDTDQNALCAIEFGTVTSSYGEVPVTETSYNRNHAIHIPGLIFSTAYYYEITCTDNLSNVVNSEEKNFTTLETQVGESEAVTADTTAPGISGVSASGTTGETMTVTWDTDEVANSLVGYGLTSGKYENMAGNSLVNGIVDNYVTSHEVIINNLTPSTKYYYIVISVDAAGNVTQSSESTFTTKSPSALSSINVTSLNLNQVTITWTTSVNTTSVVEYGLTVAYGSIQESTTKTKTHEVTISGLRSGQLYHFRVKGKDPSNNLYSSGDYTFQPKSPPGISDISVDSVSDKTAKIKFATSVPTDALVTYTNTQDSQQSSSQGKPDLLTSHKIELGNLDPGITYAIQIKVRDESGNETEKEGGNFTTDKDTAPPQLSEVKTNAALTQNDKVQTIISWDTDEPSSTIIIYRQGAGGEDQELTIDDNLTNHHVAVITSFKPGEVYNFRVKSADQSGNAAISEEYAFLAPRQKENVVQFIVSIFQDIFKWAGF